MTRASFSLVTLLLLVAGCSDAPTTPSDLNGAAARPGPSDPTPTWTFPSDESGLGFASDGQGPVYANGSCGVSTRLFSTTAGSGSGDATIQTSKTKSCTRKFKLLIPGGGYETVQSFNNLNALESSVLGIAIPVGGSELRRLIVSPSAVINNPSTCGRIIFGDNGTVGSGT
ncbi:MAG: hypothetical protein OEW80_12870, partial [Gemmatimonadota bacterium]|nr:hypothetical protein [Gemmatimonadota bacterium]